MRVNLSPEITLPREIHVKAGSSEKTFSEHLAAATNDNISHHLDQEMEVIHELGRRLSRSLALSDLKKYREKVADFLKFCVSQGLCCEEQQFPARYGRSKILSIVKTVNKRLLTLAELMLSENKNSINVMALVDEIRGLLFDLYA